MVFKKKVQLKHKIMVLAIFIVLITLSTVGFIIERIMVNFFEEQLSEYAMGIAHSVAEIPEVQNNVGLTDGHLKIQPIAEQIRKKTNAEFIVVIDMERIRYSHPVLERIGQTFVGGDEGEVLRGKEYISQAIGTLGPSLRAFVPVYRDGQQVGAVSVGIMLTAIKSMVAGLRNWILAAICFGLIIGILGANYLAENIKNSLFGLEPQQISSILRQRDAILESVREGIIAINKDRKIIFLNNEARKILNLQEENVYGKDIKEFVPNTRLVEVIKTGKAEYDMEQNIRNTRIITNRVPIKVNDEVVGAIASFRDMTEIQVLAQELTGVKSYVEALRVHNHEFSNKLHTILGLIHLGNYQKAANYISETVSYHQDLISFVTKRIKEPAVCGLLIGKIGRCKELGIDFKIDNNSYLGELNQVNYNNLVVIIGNLLENAIDAVQLVDKKRRKITFSIFDESKKIFISVKDTGPGILDSIVEKVFNKGYTSKGKEEGGYGLYLVKSLVESYNGEIDLETEIGRGTEFAVTIPNEVIE